MTSFADGDLIAGTHMELINGHAVGECGVSILCVPNDLTTALDRNAAEICIPGRTASLHDHIGQGNVGRGVEVARMSDGPQDCDANQGRGSDDRLLYVLGEVLADAVRELSTKDSVEWEIGHARQFQMLAAFPILDRQSFRFGEDIRSLNLNEDAVTFLEVALLEPGAKEPRLARSMTLLRRGGHRIELRAALELAPGDPDRRIALTTADVAEREKCYE